ncbi:kinase-like domain-containing protein [Nemania sp. FL0031]|nr:kinase-like domain-containing protein [Nemania sp. FL0031]
MLQQEATNCCLPRDSTRRVPRQHEMNPGGDAGRFPPYHAARNGTGAQHNDGRAVNQPPKPPPDFIRVRPEGMGKLVRRPISTSPLYTQYPRIQVLDGGDDKAGGMNGGVYVVQCQRSKRLYAEKVFRTDSSVYAQLAKAEIKVMRRLMHNCIIHYVDAYIREDPFEASVYMEHCDRGTLDDLIRVYRDKKKMHDQDRIPESFIWHAFLGLADALGYLQTGQSYISMPLEKNNRSDWKPIVHCDIKPGNIFLRSRDTPGSTKPFYTLLADFGLMGHEPEILPGGYCKSYGTVEFHAPELAFDPYPIGSQKGLMASPHTIKSDVWALACTIFCMCERDGLAHMDRTCWPPRSRRALGRMAKRPSLDITDTHIYSKYLARTIAWAANSDLSQRPDSWALVAKVKEQYDLWIQDPAWKSQVEVNGALPKEVTKEFML